MAAYLGKPVLSQQYEAMSHLLPRFRRPQLIISGGQTGVDRAALDVAIALGIPHGGWCPRGRRAEDGRAPDHYLLRETATVRYGVRTRLNVEQADATLIIAPSPLSGGTRLTLECALQAKKPCLMVEPDPNHAATQIAHWLVSQPFARESQHAAAGYTLNVAGPRESQLPGIYRLAQQILQVALA